MPVFLFAYAVVALVFSSYLTFCPDSPVQYSLKGAVAVAVVSLLWPYLVVRVILRGVRLLLITEWIK